MQVAGQTLLDLIDNAGDVTSDLIVPPPQTTAMLLTFERVSAAPGTAAGIQLEVEMPVSASNVRKLYKSSSFDVNAVDYYGYLVGPGAGLLAAYNSGAPVLVSAVVLALIPRVFRVFVDRATSQNVTFRLKAHWFLG